MQKITPFLWFEGNAEEAANFYVSVFKDSKVLSVTRTGDAGPGPKGSVLVMSFQLAGQKFIALNGNRQFKFNQSISLFVDCESQAEVDEYWNKLTADGGKPVQCGWLEDKFGLSWQIVPSLMIPMLQDKDPAKSQRAMKAMMGMVKLDIAELKKAYLGE